MTWPLAIANARGSALIADRVPVSEAVPTVPTVMVWPNQRRSAPEYNQVTGVFTFERDTFFSSTANWHVHGATSKYFYADAERSTDGGATWTVGINSLRIESVNANGRTAAFGFDGHFSAGEMLRFIYWASATGVTIDTETFSGSTSAASRLTVAMIYGSTN